jgi:hypothetical protein
MNINQLNLSYVATEDRVLLRLNTQEQSEFRLWITRNLARGLLEVIEQTSPHMAVERAHHIGLAPEESRRLALARRTESADFATPYSEKAESYPLGETPRLITQMQLKLTGDHTTLHLNLDRNMKLELNLDQGMFMALARMLIELLDTVDWGLGTAQTKPADNPISVH